MSGSGKAAQHRRVGAKLHKPKRSEGAEASGLARSARSGVIPTQEAEPSGTAPGGLIGTALGTEPASVQHMPRIAPET